MTSPNDSLEIIWDSILSREHDQIHKAFASLDQASQRSILLHLIRMAREPGWLPVQKQSAQFALDTLMPCTGEDALQID